MRRPTGDVNAAYSSTLGNGVRVLELLREHPEGLGVNAIAAALGIHRTAVYRLTGTLRTHDLLTKGPDGGYRLGIGLITLASTVRSGLRETAGPHLAALAEQVAATAFLTLAEDDHAVNACVAEPRNARLHVGYRLGYRHPLTVSAAGLAILAGRPPVPGERAEVSTARDRGFAVTAGEIEPGAWGLAVPLPAEDGLATASVGVVALSSLEVEPTAAAVRGAAAAISAQ